MYELVLIGATSVWIGTFLVKTVLAASRRRSLAQKAQHKRKRNLVNCQLLLDRLHEDQELVAKKDQITKLSLDELIDALQSGRLKARDAVRAYQLKALEVNQDLNCLVEPILEAEDEADALDRSGSIKGPLHGVPISLKDHFFVKGYDSHIGLAKKTYSPAEDDYAIVKILREQGAIPIVKTVVPQMMMSVECTNPIEGAASNAHAQDRSPGGSSGGEGALIAAGGSILGVGSDIGGSIRIPSHFNGIYGLKPGSDRISSAGEEMFLGMSVVHGSFGPMARDVNSLARAMKSLLVPEMTRHDKQWPPVPFNQEMYTSKRPLKIGYYSSEGVYNPVPPCQRAVEIAKARLEAQGHQLVPFQWGEETILDACYYGGKAIFADGGAEFLRIMKDETVDGSLKYIMFYLNIPYWIRCGISRLLKPIVNKGIGRLLTVSAGCRDAGEMWDLEEAVKRLKRKCIAQWEVAGLDALICPVSTVVAFRPGDSKELSDEKSFGIAFTLLYNVLNFPAGVAPVTTVSDKDIEDTASYPTPGLAEKCAKKVMAGAKGLPVCVQCVTLPWQEEQCLRVMKDIENGKM